MAPKIRNLLAQGDAAPLGDTEVLSAILAEIKSIRCLLEDQALTPRQRDAAMRHQQLRDLAVAIGAAPGYPGAGDLLAALTYRIGVPTDYETLRDALARDPATPRSIRQLYRVLTDN